MVLIGNMSTARDIINRYKIDEVWCIVRSLKMMPRFGDIPVFHKPDLSPSRELFFTYNNQWRYNGWGKELFSKKYLPWFLRDMHSNASRHALNALYIKQKEKNILLLCFCADEAICHRSIVAGLLQGAGADVLCKSDYSQYYAMYKDI